MADDVRSFESSVAAVLVPLFSALGGTLGLFCILALLYYLRFSRNGRIMLGAGMPGAYDDEQHAIREEQMYLHTLDEPARQAYFRAKGKQPDGPKLTKAYQEANPPDSQNTDISLSQFMAIQEKGVSAWEFEPDLEATNCIVECRTEVTFFDTECSVQTNLPVPKQNDMYYWEAKLYDMPANTIATIGVATKPYPTFRMPGYSRFSVGYLTDGTKRVNQPFFGKSYGPECRQGDVIGCGYKPRTGTVFFTRNGKKLDEGMSNMRRNIFPSIGANGPCTIHVNFGQAGFVFIEANVKKWGLAPMTGTLQPPPAYGSSELGDSVLLAAGFNAGRINGTTTADIANRGLPSPLSPANLPYLSSDISLTNLPQRPAVPGGTNAPPDYTSDSSTVDDGQPGPSQTQPLLSPDLETTGRFERM